MVCIQRSCELDAGEQVYINTNGMSEQQGVSVEFFLRFLF